MTPERWPGEPLRDRLTAAERDEVQAYWVRQWLARKRRERYEITHGSRVPVKRYDMQGRRVSRTT